MGEPTSDSIPPDSRHEVLWAPWRIAYIRENIKKKADCPSVNESRCFLCDYCDPKDDKENLVIARTMDAMVVLNRYPYNNGHLLVAPRLHKGTFEELTDSELLGCMKEVQRMIAAMDRLMKPHGYNVGLNLGHVAGAGLPGHLHWHIVPRWTGDTNFMDVTCETSVIPESLNAFYELLTEELRKEL